MMEAETLGLQRGIAALVMAFGGFGLAFIFVCYARARRHHSRFVSWIVEGVGWCIAPMVMLYAHNPAAKLILDDKGPNLVTGVILALGAAVWIVKR